MSERDQWLTYAGRGMSVRLGAWRLRRKTTAASRDPSAAKAQTWKRNLDQSD